MDEALKALADAGRRQLLDSLNSHNGQSLRELCTQLDMTRQSVSKHLAVLESANLVTTIRHGREKLHYLNAAPINAIAERWINQYDRERVHALADLKIALETTPMSEQDVFVYTTYIRTTPDKLWQALTDPAVTSRYWGVSFHTDWTPGSAITWEENGQKIVDEAQIVREAEPGRRLSYTWHTPTPEWAQAAGISEELRARLAAERRSTVTFDIEDLGELVKLTVTHHDFEPGSTMRAMISQGWPALVSSLKTLLETGQVLPDPASVD